MKNTSAAHNYTQLDSLRGLASLQVLNQHLIIMAPIMFADTFNFEHSAKALERFIYWLQYSPLHLIYMSYEAVVFFFVLSGFVLYSSLSKKVTFRIYGQYIIKRFFRLYLPFIAALLLSIGCRAVFYRHQDLSAYSLWFRGMWEHRVTLSEFSDLIVFNILAFHNVVTSLWSIDVEIKISLLIPAFIFFINALRRFVIIDLILNLSVAVTSFIIFHHAADYFSESEGVVLNLFVMRFCFAFIAGIMLSKYLPYIRNFIHRLSLPIVSLVVVLALLFYGVNWYPWLIPSLLRTLIGYQYHTEFIILASCLFIGISFNKHVSQLLNHRFLLHLGKISFSLYLLHPIIMLVTTYTLASLLPMPVLWVIIIIVSLFAAHFFYNWFEMPVNNFGRKLAGRLGGKRSLPANGMS